MPEGYTLVGYGRMLVDAARIEAYGRALKAAVRADSVVLDLGTGTGFFAVLAAKLGARRVYGIDPSDAIRAARELARENGVADRVEFIQDVSTRVTLPERADVLVCDLRGVLPPFQDIVGTMADARARLLAPGATLIPRRDTLLAAPLESAEAWEDALGPAEALGIDLAAARRAAANGWTRGRFHPGQLLAEPLAWAELDYRAATGPDVRGGGEWTVSRAGTAHGLAVWFQADLGFGSGFGSGPGTRTIYQTAFFPWPGVVAVVPGDRIRAELRASLVAGEYVWFWDSAVERAGKPPVAFRQTTFVANAPSPDRLRRRGDGYLAALGEDGRIDSFVLSRMDGRTPLGQIARELKASFPDRFATWEAALVRAGALSERYAG
ncbi:MAG TPA: 50S ribosomal protein L11 methyltransferase [Longimicrobium sp.]|nr:50S ribosomal protein L11 methyltransferase [Longimicrobium sp.]